MCKNILGQVGMARETAKKIMRLSVMSIDHFTFQNLVLFWAVDRRFWHRWCDKSDAHFLSKTINCKLQISSMTVLFCATGCTHGCQTGMRLFELTASVRWWRCVSALIVSSSKRNANQNDNENWRRTRSVSPLPCCPLLDNGHPPCRLLESVAQRARTSPRNSNHCQDIPQLETNWCCSGCIRCEESNKKKPWDQIKTREMKCF